MKRLGLIAAMTLALAACGGSSNGQKSVVIVVGAPFTVTPYVGQTIYGGVELAAKTLNQNGGIQTKDGVYHVNVEKLDNGLSSEKAVENMRQAVADHAVGVVDEGTGIDASWKTAEQANLPVGIVYQGGIGLVDPAARPNVFRIAPTDRGMAFRLAEYMVPKHLKIAILTDQSDYGTEGAAALDKAFAGNEGSITKKIVLPTSATDLSPQVLQARRSGATALLVWASAQTIAKVVIAARSSGWNVPFFTPASAEDPILRQELAGHPGWLDDLTFASGRMTAEEGPGPFMGFQTNYEQQNGPDYVGVKTKSGLKVIQPPDFAMYAYDFVNVLAAAIVKAGNPHDGAAVLRALNQVTVEGVNGDERGFNTKNHEGVIDDDIYFARFHDMTFAPVKDDPLSSTLPTITQTSG
jgi:ABC-type branched-subunit amino acid transport system substrate-binding protein